MYHVELRQFPHNFCRFNLTERELRDTILDAWAQGEWIELGERKWNPHQAQLTVLEGPQLALEQLSMGRGWRAATRRGEDVTERLLVAARADAASAVGPGGRGMDATISTGADGRRRAGERDVRDTSLTGSSAPDVGLLADSLGLEILAKLSKQEPMSLALAWRLACERHPDWTASEGLRLAEHAVRSLARSQLAVVLVRGDGGEQQPCASEEQVEDALRAVDGWASPPGAAAVSIRKA